MSATRMPGDRQPPDIEPGRFAVLVDPQGAAFAVVTLNGTPA